MTDTAFHVYTAINAVQDELAKIGIAKDGVNEQQKYKFRGIDQVYAALSPLLAKHGLCVLPRVLGYDRTERTTMKPGYQGQPPKESTTFYVTVEAEFDFVSVKDGSRHTIRTIGEAMDNGDKATNKAMSAAYKYAAFMAFAIPTEGDNDADATTHEVTADVGATQARRSAEKVKDAPFPQGPAKNITELKTIGRELWRDIEAAEDGAHLDSLIATNAALFSQLERALPSWIHGGQDKQGQTFEGLQAVIDRLRYDFDQIGAAQKLVDTVRAG